MFNTLDWDVILESLIQVSITKENQECLIASFVKILDISNQQAIQNNHDSSTSERVIVFFISHWSHSLISLTMNKWASIQGEQEGIARILWNRLKHQQDLDFTILQSCTFFLFLSLYRVTSNFTNVVLLS